MKNTKLFKLIILIGITPFLFTACEPEGEGDGTTNSPTVSFGAGSGQDITVNPAEEFSVSVTASKGSADLNAIAVYEDGTLISSDRIKFNGAAAVANAQLLAGVDRTSLSYIVAIQAHAEANVTKTYSIEVKDANQNSRSVSLDVTTVGTPPILTYTGPATFNAAPNSNVSVKLKADKGSGKISTIAVYENDQLIDASRAEIAGSKFTSNPHNLPEVLQNGFDGMLILQTSNSLGSNKYKVEITDEFGGVSSQEFTIDASTPIESIMGVLLNQAGPSGQGGLDLDTGNGNINSTSTDAEIRDLGIDTSLPNASNWRQQISGANGAELRRVIAGQEGVSESFKFSDVSTQEEILALASVGTVVSQSVKLTGGETFIVSRDGKTYLIEIAKVTPTSADNSDSYEINIKK